MQTNAAAIERTYPEEEGSHEGEASPLGSSALQAAPCQAEGGGSRPGSCHVHPSRSCVASDQEGDQAIEPGGSWRGGVDCAKNVNVFPGWIEACT